MKAGVETTLLASYKPVHQTSDGVQHNIHMIVISFPSNIYLPII